MNRGLMLVAAAALAFATCASVAQEVPADAATVAPAPSSDSTKIEGLKGVVGMDVVMVQSGIHYGDWSMTNKNAQQGMKDLDDNVGAALKAAAGRPDLAAAIKAYYIAASAYFQNAWSDPTTPALIVDSNAAQLKADMDSKASAMMLEAKFN